MQLTTPGIVIDYADEQWSVEDQATGIVAYTNDPSAIFPIVQAFGRVSGDGWYDGDDDEPETGTRDSGDEDPHA